MFFAPGLNRKLSNCGSGGLELQYNSVLISDLHGAPLLWLAEGKDNLCLLIMENNENNHSSKDTTNF